MAVLTVYKVIKNNEIIDVLDELYYVRKNPRNGVIISCTSDRGQGVISYDGSTLYKLDDALGDEYDAVTLEPIDEVEFKRLRDLLDGVEQEPEVVDPEFPTEDEENESVDEIKEPMSIAEMRAKIIYLEEQLAAAKILLGVE